MWAEWWKGCQVFVCILALWMQCGFSGIVCGFPVASQHLVEAQDGGAVGVAWPFPSGLASSPLRAFIEHFRL